MPELCATLGDETVCMPVDLTVFEDPRQGEVPEPPGNAPGELESTGAPAVRTRVAWGAVVRTAGGPEESHALELVLLGDRVFRAIMGRAP